MRAETSSQFTDSEEITAEELLLLDLQIAELDELLAKLIAELQDA